MAKPLKSKTRKKNAGPAMSFKVAGLARTFLLSSFPYILSLTLIGVLFGCVYAYAVNSPTFELSEVKIFNVGSMTTQQAFQFCELRPGENLINLDLVNVQQVIKSRHPEFKEVRVRRVLPNRLEVVLRRRTPIAQIDYSRFVQIDKDFVILPGSAPEAFHNLTTIEGAPLPRPGLFVGAVITDDLTRKAVRLSEIVKQYGVLRNHVLSKIDIRDPKNLSLIVDTDVEIRLGDGHFIERLKILDQTLKTLALDRSKVRYIDLRFDDVVVGPR